MIEIPAKKLAGIFGWMHSVFLLSALWQKKKQAGELMVRISNVRMCECLNW